MKRFFERVSTSFRAWPIRLSVFFSAMLTISLSAADPFAAASQPTANQSTNGPEAAVELSAVAQLGRKMFFDPSLSGSGQLACASCHSPAHAYGPPNDLVVQFGGPDLKRTGVRAVPSLRYLEHDPNFSIGPSTEMADNDPPPPDVAPAGAPAGQIKVATVAKADANSAARAAAEANVPRGGLDWDGRANTLQLQALGPLLDPNEMDNHSTAELLERLEHAAYADDIKKLFGANIFNQRELALDEALFALARFQTEDPSFHPYDSKYDAVLAGKAVLSEAEARGLKLFDDPKKGNCSSCHIDRATLDGVFRPAFTDYQFEALGAPRNRDIPANRDPHFYDLGLCGPLRKDYATAPAYCGLFKTPTLRNTATRKVFFHNGVFHSLEEVMHFYVERETDPAKWYPKRGNGEVDRYNDLPPEYRGNIDIVDAPFDSKLGDPPALSDVEIADVIAFLKTLTDGYRPDQPSASTTPAPH
ncbi:cytochrome-c peroxidase [Bradyrhizobium canariense]|uniref:Cytochrome c peroxidase n=1 Tax=Bradyrhizobium canariense TaxID=255045 RepID=A0A1H1ZET7_9BRAD|nr:cytochrome c peroxidase [Bradyrhizobium canariense]SDT32139.1 cytochrome c peroxidase [Bradyrhizobium canariense]